jgi:hypothetical protein
MDMAKKWKYEADCKRIEALIEETVAEGKRPGWGHCAMRVLLALRIVRPKSTPLALHFVSTSAKEMLSKRHENAKLCLVVAMSLTNPALMVEQMRLFMGTFAKPCDCDACKKEAEQETDMLGLLKGLFEKMGSKLVELPEGISDLEVAPGVMAKVIKASLGKKKGKKQASGLPAATHPMTGDPRLN